MNTLFRKFVYFISLSTIIFSSAHASEDYQAKYQQLLRTTLMHSSNSMLNQWLGEERASKGDIQGSLAKNLDAYLDESQNEESLSGDALQSMAEDLAVTVLADNQIEEGMLQMDIGAEEADSEEGAMAINLGRRGPPPLTKEQKAPCAVAGGMKVVKIPGYYFIPGRNVDASISFSTQPMTSYEYEKKIIPLKMNGRVISKKVLYRKKQITWSPMAQLLFYKRNESGKLFQYGMKSMANGDLELKANTGVNLPIHGPKFVFTGKRGGSGVKLYGENGSATNFVEVQPSGRSPVCIFVNGAMPIDS